MNEEKKYKLVGVINYFDVHPTRLYPIFLDENGDYCGGFIFDDNSPYIEIFQGFFPEEMNDRIILFEDIKDDSNTTLIKEDVKDEYQIGDLAIEAISPCNGTIYIGTIDKFLEYTKRHKENLETIYYGNDNDAKNNLINNEFQGHEDNVLLYLGELEHELADAEHRVSSLRK